MSDKPRVALITNMVTPYRVEIYDALAEAFDLTVFETGREEDRKSWGDVASKLKKAKVDRIPGLVVPLHTLSRSAKVVTRYLHLPTGVTRALAKTDPHAVVSVEMGPRSLAAVRFGVRRKIPTYVWWGGTEHSERNLSKSKRALRSWFVGSQTRFVSYGQAATQYLRTIGVDEGRVVTIQNCSPDRAYTADDQAHDYGLPGPVLLVVGRLIEQKGLLQLLSAAERAVAEGTNFSLVLIGEGPLAPEVRRRAEQLGDGRVTLLDQRDAAEMPRYYRGADALIFPTLQDVWGHVANEAMWCDTPVLGSVYAGSSEELLDAEDCFDPLDPDDFDRGLRRAALGELKPPDKTRLWTSQRAADAIVQDIQRQLAR